MKNLRSVFPKALAAMTVTSLGLCFAAMTANAQSAAATNLSTAPPPAAMPAPAPALAYGASEAVKMYQAGIDKDVIVSYINSTSLPYHLGTNAVLQLQSSGIPQEIIDAMRLRDAQMQQQQVAQQVAPPQPILALPTMSNEPPAEAPPVQILTPATPPPAVAVDGSVDSYSYPDFGYDGLGYYEAPLIIGGWGYPGFHGRGGYGGFHGRGGHGGFHGGGGFGGFHGGFGGGHGGRGGGGHR